MAVVKYFPLRIPDAVHRYVDMGGLNTATVGDYLAFSGKQVIAIETSLGWFKHSGIGIALDNNPKWTNGGSAYYLTAMPVGKNGTFRVSSVSANYSAGDFVFPVATGSGIVGQTGRTGKASLWSATAVMPSYITAQGAGAVTASAAPGSGVGRILRVLAQGATTGQMDIELFDGFLALHQT